MNAPIYMTLAAARLADPEKFDAGIRSAVSAAAAQLDRAVLIRALCAPKSVFVQADQKKAA